MDQPLYTIGQVAQKASVSMRTLRYYEQQGLLSPSSYSEGGYRLYAEEEFARLQSILALKFLGFSLEEIRIFLQNGTDTHREMLAKQKAMMEEKRSQLDRIIRAMNETERLLQTSGQPDVDAIVQVIRVMQMELKPEWVSKYLSEEERVTMRDLAKSAYSEAAMQKMAAQGWTEEQHQESHQRYAAFRAELTRLVSEGADPAGEEGQALAHELTEINRRRSQGDPEILAGMRKSWEQFNALPEEKKPALYAIPEEERAFIKKASTVYHSRKAARP